MIGRVNAGGGGSLQATDAILRVIAPAGSTVTISKGGVSKSDAGHENAADNTLYDYYFIIHQSQFDSINPWTVTATLGADSATDTIIINSADEYDMELSYNVPSEYQGVEYIQSSGTQYIKTGITQTTTQWGFDIDFMPLNSFGSQGRCIFGRRAGSGQEYQLNCFNDGSGYNGTFYFGSGKYAARMTQNSRLQSSLHNYTLTVANGTQTTISSASIGNVECYVFAGNNNGTVNEQASMRLYGLKLYDASDTLVGDYRPCYRKADSVAGLWDRVSETFLTNSGTGTFSVGGDI